MVPAQSFHRKASDTFARLVMSCSFYKAITSSYETPRDWNFTFLHHLYVSRCPLWQIAIPHPIRSDLALPPCFSFFEQKMTVNKGRLVECKRRSVIPSGSLNHKDPPFVFDCEHTSHKGSMQRTKEQRSHVWNNKNVYVHVFKYIWKSTFNNCNKRYRVKCNVLCTVQIGIVIISFCLSSVPRPFNAIIP